MATLLNLPTELRCAIWDSIPADSSYTTFSRPTPPQARFQSSQRAYKSLCCTCKALNAEVRVLLYRNIQLTLQHPNELLHWVAKIGSNNSSYIENLILTSSQLVEVEDAQTWANESAWALALRSMPRLQSLNIQFAQKPSNPVSESMSEEITIPSPVLLQELSISAFENSGLAAETSSVSILDRWKYQPSLRQQPFTHAFISLHEPMPPVLVQYFNTTARSGQSIKSPGPESLGRITVERNVTGLTATFFEENDFHLTNTCAFNNNNESANAVLTFTRKSQHFSAPCELARGMMHDLPNLAYLRIGCHKLNSSILVFVPRHLHTLDAAFTDNDAKRVADNLMTMRGICKKLFTLAIAVSPLHDRQAEGSEEEFFERSLVTAEVSEKWTPFWQALDEIRASKVKVWEGEGPGFSRQNVR